MLKRGIELAHENDALTLFNLGGGGGGSFLPAGFLISYNFLSVYGMNLKFYDFS